jgi:hypothetical protein
MYERGERSLPLDALVRLADIEIALDKHPPVPQEGELSVNISHPFFDPASITGKLQEEVKQSRRAIEDLKEELLYMRTTYEYLQCWARVLAGRSGDAGFEKWLELYMGKLSGRIDLVSPEKQFMLQHRIETKLAALAVAEKALQLLGSEIPPDQT